MWTSTNPQEVVLSDEERKERLIYELDGRPVDWFDENTVHLRNGREYEFSDVHEPVDEKACEKLVQVRC